MVHKTKSIGLFHFTVGVSTSLDLVLPFMPLVQKQLADFSPIVMILLVVYHNAI